MKVELPRAVVLDLDDTLYLERDYVRSGFNAVSKYVEETDHIQDFFERAWALFINGSRGDIFNTVLRDLGICESRVDKLVEIYRGHVPDIKLCDDAIRFFDRFPKTNPLGMITDGPVSCQSRKISALGLATYCMPIIMSDEIGINFRKPHEAPYLKIEQLWKTEPSNIVYIADNPLKDFITPRRMGWKTIRIIRRHGEHSSRPMSGDYAADAKIQSFDELTW